MQHFKYICNLDTSAALNEVINNKVFFASHVGRPEQSYPLREGRSIHLRVHDVLKRTSDLSDFRGAKEQADKMIEAADSPLFKYFPMCRELMYSAMDMMQHPGKLGRCYIAKMSPGGKVYPHVDPGRYFELHDRYHIVLSTNENVSFSCGNEVDTETVHFKEGEVWVFNNKVTHWASNNGDTDRIHIIMDISHDSPHYPQ